MPAPGQLSFLVEVRDRTGAGQVVETSLLRTSAWTIGCDVSVALVDGLQPNKRARDDAFGPMNTRFRCADGWINLAAFNQPNEADLVDALRIGCPQLLSLVAELDGRVVGHILFSPVTLPPSV